MHNSQKKITIQEDYTLSAKAFYGPYNPSKIPLSWKNANTITFGKRKEYEVKLEMKYGELPTDLYGIVYVTIPGGSVNSNGIPYPQHYFNQDGTIEYNPEYSSPILGCDGIVLKFDFNTEGEVRVLSKLMNVPSLIADEALKRNNLTVGSEHKHAFKNYGILRASLYYGIRNLANTAVIPFKFDDDENTRMMIAYDLGRQFEYDPVSMQMMTPIGRMLDWKFGTPNILNWAFPMIESTAHPSFDPNTKEFFTANYTRSLMNLMTTPAISILMEHTPEVVEKYLEDLAQKFEEKKKELNILHLGDLIKKIADKIDDWLEKLPWVKDIEDELEHLIKNAHQIFEKELDKIEDWQIFKEAEKLENLTPENEVILMRWIGKKDIHKWRVVDENGKNIVIRQCMHQTQITEDYIILADSSFKTVPSVLINNPFPSNWTIDRFLRELLAAPMLPYLQLYLIKRSDLSLEKDTVKALKIPKPIPLESIHFSVNYANPNDEITLFLNQNIAACVAEWLRPYDELLTVKNAPPLNSLLGIYALGGMDLNSFGKYVLDGASGEIKGEPLFTKTEGNVDDPNHIGAHTWELDFYTYRDIISDTNIVQSIDYIYCLSEGLDPRMLTKYIYNMYHKTSNRTIPVEDMIKYSERIQPSCLIRIDTETMDIGDYYQFPPDWNTRSVQFIPRKTPTSDLPYQQDGYIWVTLITCINADESNEDKRLYTPEMWLFRAEDLSAGPICVMGHEDMTWATTLHSVWIEKDAPPNNTYNIDIKEDFNSLFETFWNKNKKQDIENFFEEHVYPVWYAQKPK